MKKIDNDFLLPEVPRKDLYFDKSLQIKEMGELKRENQTKLTPQLLITQHTQRLMCPMDEGFTQHLPSAAREALSELQTLFISIYNYSPPLLRGDSDKNQWI